MMIIQFILKGLFFTFLFFLARSFWRGYLHMKAIKGEIDRLKSQHYDPFQGRGAEEKRGGQGKKGEKRSSQSGAGEDIIEADFRHL